VPLRVNVRTYALASANEALNDLCRGHVKVVKVLLIKTKD
jgi:hypothetical protein